MTEAAGGVRRWWPFGRFEAGVVLGGLIVGAVLLVRGLFGPDSPAVIPEGQPDAGVEWAKLTLTRPGAETVYGAGETRWAVVATPAGPGVLATADLLGNGLVATMLFAPSASPTYAYTIDLEVDAAAAFGALGPVRLAATESRIDREATIETGVLSSGERSVQFGVFRVAAAAMAEQLRSAAGLLAAFSLAPEQALPGSGFMVSFAIGDTGRAAFAEAFGW